MPQSPKESNAPAVKIPEGHVSYTLMWGEEQGGLWWWSVTNGPALVVSGSKCISSDDAFAAANIALDAHLETHTSKNSQVEND